RRHRALRMGDWKIVRTHPDEPWQLFNLVRDVGETTDLSTRNSAAKAALLAELKRWEQMH
ncbi:MAG: N-acetylgalactosamine-4-sulfatase, partial [Planctomycetaceae bacterium]